MTPWNCLEETQKRRISFIQKHQNKHILIKPVPLLARSQPNQFLSNSLIFQCLFVYIYLLLLLFEFSLRSFGVATGKRLIMKEVNLKKLRQMKIMVAFFQIRGSCTLDLYKTLNVVNLVVSYIVWLLWVKQMIQIGRRQCRLGELLVPSSYDFLILIFAIRVCLATRQVIQLYFGVEPEMVYWLTIDLQVPFLYCSGGHWVFHLGIISLSCITVDHFE